LILWLSPPSWIQLPFKLFWAQVYQISGIYEAFAKLLEFLAGIFFTRFWIIKLHLKSFWVFAKICGTACNCTKATPLNMNIHQFLIHFFFIEWKRVECLNCSPVSLVLKMNFVWTSQNYCSASSFTRFHALLLLKF
jgi:hypothetical protein